MKLLFTLLLALPAKVFCEEMSIFEVRRNIPLSDTDPIYKDFYIKGNESTGLKKNLVVQVNRKMTLRDATGSQVMGEVLAPVGQLKIIAVYGKIAVAREYKNYSRDELPMLESPWFMIGDSIEMKDSFLDKTTKK
ncbi:MAG: hypothetical protein L6Q37_16210 [Bdellovibrionaceae bacterium]|nr:hypothetical protein [Pseudobdellovibrionaceae bacterium]NUM59533.1 hypothetical protein [Pseudobdellovibrionaceae bacterium]